MAPNIRSHCLWERTRCRVDQLRSPHLFRNQLNFGADFISVREKVLPFKQSHKGKYIESEVKTPPEQANGRQHKRCLTGSPGILARCRQWLPI